MSSTDYPPETNWTSSSVLNFTEYIYSNFSLVSASMASGVNAEWGTQVISASLFGALTICAGAAVIALLSKRSRDRPRAILISFIAAMYTATGLFLSVNLYTFSTGTRQAKDVADNMYSALDCMDAVVGGDSTDVLYTCATLYDSVPAFNPFAVTQPCIGTVTLTVNVALGDAIVWWRAWAVWQCSPIIRYIGTLLVLGTLVMSILDSVDACRNIFFDTGTGYLMLDLLAGPGTFFEGDKYGVAASILSLVTNVVATSLIAYKAWEHRRLIHEHFRSRSRSSQVERSLIWLIESGIVYCIIWTLIVLYQMLPFRSLLGLGSDTVTNNAIQSFVIALDPFVNGALVPVIAIYPTIIILLVALNKSYCDTAIIHTVDSMVDQSIVFQHPMNSTSEVDREEDLSP